MTTSIINFEERRFERLPPRELSRQLMRLPARRRLELIVQRPDAELVVKAMSVQDFYLSVKEIGLEDSLPFLTLAKVEQLNFLFDLEWWRKDSIQAASALEWLQLLSRAGEEKVLAWLRQADFELLVTLFKKWILATTAPEDTDLLESRDELPKNTLDDQFYWEAQYPQYESLLSFLLSLLFEVHYGFYSQLMNHVIWTTQVGMEEEAYRFATGRLEDQAIPDFYDALEIYRAIRSEEIVPNKEALFHASADLSTPSFALALLAKKDLMALALSEIQDPRLLETLQVELASLANKVIVADQLAVDNPDGVRQAVDKVSAYVNLGLDLICNGDLKMAVMNLSDVFLEHLFRLGHTQLSRLRARLQRILQKGWLSEWPAGLKCLDPEWMQAVELMLQQTPQLPRGASETNAPAREDLFRDRRDLLKGKQLVDMILSLEPLFEGLRVEPDRLRNLLWQEGQISNLEDVTLGVMILTAAAQCLQTGRWEMTPLEVDSWPALFPLVEPRALRKAIHSWLDSTLDSPSDRTHAEAYLSPLFQAYAEEMASFTGERPPDAQLVRFFLFVEPGVKT